MQSFIIAMSCGLFINFWKENEMGQWEIVTDPMIKAEIWVFAFVLAET